MTTATFTVTLHDDVVLDPDQIKSFQDFLRDTAHEALLISEIQAACGGPDASHPDYLIADWVDDVEHLKTRESYWGWVLEKLIEAGEIEEITDDEDDT